MADDGWNNVNSWNNEDSYNQLTPQNLDNSEHLQSYRSPGSKSPWKQDNTEYIGESNKNADVYKSEENYLLKKLGYNFESMFDGEKKIFKRN